MTTNNKSSVDVNCSSSVTTDSNHGCGAVGGVDWSCWLIVIACKWRNWSLSLRLLFCKVADDTQCNKQVCVLNSKPSLVIVTSIAKLGFLNLVLSRPTEHGRRVHAGDKSSKERHGVGVSLVLKLV